MYIIYSTCIISINGYIKVQMLYKGRLSGVMKSSFLLFCSIGVHCGIYKSFYTLSNISYMNSPPPPLFFLPCHHPFMEQFQQVSFLHLHTCVHSICKVFTLLYPLPTMSPPPLVSTHPLIQFFVGEMQVLLMFLTKVF
jgi:hypothetical protein